MTTADPDAAALLRFIANYAGRLLRLIDTLTLERDRAIAEAHASLGNIAKLCTDADRLDDGTHRGWVSTSAVRLAGGLL